jgi:ADP-L-glycero-D-manno-heptose 6-epimerase
MKKQIIVTGGAGFIGSNLVAALNVRGIDNILIVDHLNSSEKSKNLAALHYEGYFDRATLPKYIQQNRLAPVDAVFHFGACTSTTEENADYLMSNNYYYSRSLCEWALSRDARFIVASSAATYGDGQRGYSDDDTSTATLHPLNMYGYSKQFFDLWALRKGFYKKIAGLKFFNVYGPGEGHKGDMSSVVLKTYQQIMETDEVKLFKSNNPAYSDGEQVRSSIGTAEPGSQAPDHKAGTCRSAYCCRLTQCDSRPHRIRLCGYCRFNRSNFVSGYLSSSGLSALSRLRRRRSFMNNPG